MTAPADQPVPEQVKDAIFAQVSTLMFGEPEDREEAAQAVWRACRETDACLCPDCMQWKFGR